ncbi:MAG TPA: antitoxin Xre/MbcA/ParS toxin-binding domain-containing protein [Candidatus Angelobacter sp.]|nr:antitoxin Xre/MbcA/ParS toxin-binding domain-containing protein [Candidatus Angelobacter sp.]
MQNATIFVAKCHYQNLQLTNMHRKRKVLTRQLKNTVGEKFRPKSESFFASTHAEYSESIKGDPSGSDLLPNIRKKLGIRDALIAEVDLITLVEARLPVSVVFDLMQHGVLEKEIYSVIVPRRTLQHRRTCKEKLSREESDRAVRLARLAALAEKVFADRDAGMKWLRAPKKRFHGRTPMDTMATETGSRLVEEALYQIDEGMAA